jgi:UDP-GlcNAc3NAcA epimerase
LDQLAANIPVVLPVHPRTQKMIEKHGFRALMKRLIVLDPLPFLDMVRLEQEAKLILTDSGGVQKEAYFHKVPCITLRDETEWIETVNAGWNQVVGASFDRIMAAVHCASAGGEILEYGNGCSAKLIAKHLT